MNSRGAENVFGKVDKGPNTSIGTNGPTSNDPMKEDEIEFRSTLPIGRWLLIKLEKPKTLSAIISMPDIRSPYAIVVAVGPDFQSDIQPGDRVTYAECINMPREMDGVLWAKDYKWLHENKLFGRLPRYPGEKLAPTTPTDEHGRTPKEALKTGGAADGSGSD
jgi:hypothetical protein